MGRKEFTPHAAGRQDPKPCASCAPRPHAQDATRTDFPPAAEPWVIEGRVVGISDGDTITVLDLDKRQYTYARSYTDRET